MLASGGLFGIFGGSYSLTAASSASARTDLTSNIPRYNTHYHQRGPQLQGQWEPSHHHTLDRRNGHRARDNIWDHHHQDRNDDNGEHNRRMYRFYP
ncbi:hypothetical protein NDU88_013172 [Pleurodeles waltl]|uniref:Secreted protein n=1 Tax=Pleurodeles waltl TaxID=8319 RepID=A0AAV7R600_PLEWA|nr:hypothetical protein NDU88_013172 [Pleurodeles waltl]